MERKDQAAGRGKERKGVGERERKCNFMEEWKEKAERKKRQGKVQQGWKDLLESQEQWEELQEGDTAFPSLEIEQNRDWTEEGIQEAGKVLETVLTDVLAFIELSGTVQANNHHHQEHTDSKNIRTESEPAEVFNNMETKLTRGTVPPTVTEKGLQSVTVPSN